jgi:signal transduction histidine kinase
MRKAIAAREALVSSVSHDLKSPLSAICLQEQRMVRQIEAGSPPLNPEAVKRHALMISRQADRMLLMIDNMLEASRIHAAGLQLRREPRDLRDIVNHVIERLRPLLDDRGCTLSVSSPGVPCMVHWDVLSTERMIANLLTNAIKYGAGKPIQVTITMDAETAAFTISDHGRGISAEEQAHLFDRFATVGIGTTDSHGLGLWIVRRLAEAHKGTVTLVSAPGEGTTVRVALPRYAS